MKFNTNNTQNGTIANLLVNIDKTALWATAALYINVSWVFFAATAGLMTIKLGTSNAPERSFIEIKP